MVFFFFFFFGFFFGGGGVSPRDLLFRYQDPTCVQAMKDIFDRRDVIESLDSKF